MAADDSPLFTAAPAETVPGAQGDRLSEGPSPGPPTSLPSPPTPARLEILLVVLVLLLAFLLGSFPARQSAVYWHLAAGKLLAEGRYHFGVAPFTYPMEGVYWVNPHWFYDWLSYSVFRVLGGPGLVGLKTLVVVLLAGVLLRLSRAGTGWLVPALGTGMTLVALGPWLILGPTCWSYLFLASTLWLLDRPHRGREPDQVGGPNAGRHWFKTYGPLLLLFGFWANLDSGFLLGLLTVGLYALGQWAQENSRRASEGRATVLPGETRSLGWVLAAGLAVCLVNPHHVHALLSPVQSVWASTMGERWPGLGVPGWVVAPVEPWSFPASPGRGPSGIMLYLLGGLGLVSFGLNFARWCGWRVLIWLAFFGMGFSQDRALPLFAVVAGPILALNVQEFALHHVGVARPKEGSKGRWLAIGRVAGFAALGGLVAAAWPGWLQGPPYGRPQWALEPDPALPAAAAQLAQWRRQGRISPGQFGFSLAPEAANAFAWFCPQEKGFLNSRGLVPSQVAADYLALWEALEPEAGAPFPGPDIPRTDWREVLRRRHINHVVLYDPESGRLAWAFQHLRMNPKEWTLLYLNGHTAIFGWRDPDQAGAPNPYQDWHLDLDQLAFHPPPENKAPSAWPGREPRVPSWWEGFRKPRTLWALDRDEAALHLFSFAAFGRSYYQQHRALLAAGLAGRADFGASWPATLLEVGLGMAMLQTSANWPPSGQEEGATVVEQAARRLWRIELFHQEDGPPGLLLLAVRDARRALHTDPDDPLTYLLLGESYLRLAHDTRERVWFGKYRWLATLRRVQAVVALNQAARLRPDQVQVHADLAALYQEIGYLDLALEELQKYLQATRAAGPPPGETAEAFAQRLADLEKNVQQRQEQVTRLDSLFETQAAAAKVLERAQQAHRQGLAGKALQILLASDYSGFGPKGMELELYLLLTTGRVKEVREWMSPDQEDLLGEDAYQWLQIQLAAATGDYQLADHDLEEWIARSVQVPELGQSTLTVRTVLAMGIGQAVLEGHSLGGDPYQLVQIPLKRQIFLNRLGNFAESFRREGDFLVLRGLLALEAGETSQAEAAFRQALARGSGPSTHEGLDFDGRPVAAQTLELLEAGTGP
ncbi:MAG: hypothetical protein JO112_09570 [Planctomycetes bacterium]|nr:hypothetical protein [Planctomycetota bacterium]